MLFLLLLLLLLLLQLLQLLDNVAAAAIAAVRDFCWGVAEKSIVETVAQQKSRRR